MRHEIPLSIPSRDGGYFDEGKLLVELPNAWTLGRLKRMKRENASETDFVFNPGPGCEINFIIKVHSAGDPLDHTPELLFQTQKEMLEQDYWLRKFKGNFSDHAEPFGNDVKVHVLFRSLAHVSKKPSNPFTRFLKTFFRARAEQIWFTECFQLFRFQVTVLTLAPLRDVIAAKKDNETAVKEMRAAIVNYATGKTVILKINR